MSGVRHLDKKRVLAIDDADSVRAQLRQTFSGAGCARLLIVSSIRDALQSLKSESFDVILCDYYLGESTDGQQFLEYLRTHDLISRNTLFIMITAEQGYQRVVLAAECAPDDYLLKPFTAVQLDARLERLLERQKQLEPINKATDAKAWGRVVAECDKLIEARSRYLFDAMKIKGSALIREGRADEAAALYREILAQRVLPWARYGLARALALKGELGEAQGLLETNIAEFAEFMPSYDELSRLLISQGQTDGALGVLERARVISPGTMSRIRQFSELALRADRSELAETVMGEALERHKHSPVREVQDYAVLSKALTRQDKTQQALEVVSKARKAYSDSRAELLLSASECLAHQRAGNAAAAEAALQNTLARAKGALPPDIAMTVAEACYVAGHEDAGERILSQAVQNAPDDPLVREQARAVLTAAGKSPDQSAALLAAKRREIILLNNEGVAKAERGELDEAIRMLSEAADRLPNNLQIVGNAALSIAQRLQRGPDPALLRACLGYRQSLAMQAPDHPKLKQVDALLQRLKRSEAP